MLFRLLAILAFGAILSAPLSAENNVYTLASALKEVSGLTHYQSPADPPRRAGRTSSWDRTGGPHDQGNHLRMDGEEAVLLDVRGPGVLTRLWTSQPMGYLRFYWDGADEPQFSVLWRELARGDVPPLEEPFLVRHGDGASLRFPLPFQDGLKITVSGQTHGDFAADYACFHPGTEVESWWPALKPSGETLDAYTRAVAVLGQPAAAPVPGDPVRLGETSLFAESAPLVYTATRPTMVSGLSFLQAGAKPLPPSLFVAIEQGDETLRVPWRELTGSDTARAAPSLLSGRDGNRTYFRVPFILEEGEQIRFFWQGDAPGEAIGSARVHTAPLDADSPRPRLLLNQLDSSRAALSGRGRLLALNMRAADEIDSAFLGTDARIFFEGERDPSWRGTSLGDLFDAPREPDPGSRANAFSRLDFQPRENLLSAHGSFLPTGLPFSQSAHFELENPPKTTRFHGLIIGQRFGPQAPSPPPALREPALDATLLGTRRTLDEGHPLPVYTEAIPPISGSALPRASWAAGDEATSGTFELQVRSEGIDRLRVALDLPSGWTGTLSGAGRETEVYDIGWPWFDFENPPAGMLEFDWSATPPDIHPAGAFLAQLRAEAYAEGSLVYTARSPVEINLPPAGEPVLKWSGKDFQTQPGETVFHLPEGFRPNPGDVLSVHSRVQTPAKREATTATLTFEPAGFENQRGYWEKAAASLPPDGIVHAQIPTRAEGGWASFRVGSYPSWIGKPRRIAFSIPSLQDAGIKVLEARLHRRPPHPEPEGWSRRLPYIESPKERFHLPRHKALVAKNDLREKIRVVSGTPAEGINPHFRRAGFLENIESGPMVWRLAEEPRRDGTLKPSHSFEFRSEHIGARIAIHDERIIGERFFGFEFGYGPFCGTVAIRDCEGRLLAVQDLFMTEPRAFPQWTWVASPVPSRDGWIYLEVIGRPPGSLGNRIVLQKLLIGTDPEAGMPGGG